MKRSYFALELAAIVILLATARGDSVRAEKKDNQPSKQPSETKTETKEEPPQKLLSTFMRTKLDASKDVLDGVVTEDFAKVKQGAERMFAMSKAAEWNAIQGPVYAQYSSEFRRSVERLIKEANDNDIDGTGLAYMQLTMNCVSCHKYVKGTQVVQIEDKIETLGFSNSSSPGKK